MGEVGRGYAAPLPTLSLPLGEGVSKRPHSLEDEDSLAPDTEGQWGRGGEWGVLFRKPVSGSWHVTLAAGEASQSKWKGTKRHLSLPALLLITLRRLVPHRSHACGWQATPGQGTDALSSLNTFCCSAPRPHASGALGEKCTSPPLPWASSKSNREVFCETEPRKPVPGQLAHAQCRSAHLFL